MHALGRSVPAVAFFLLLLALPFSRASPADYAPSLIWPGDVNGDRQEDVVVSLPDASNGERLRCGAVLFVFGTADQDSLFSAVRAANSDFLLANAPALAAALDGANGFVVYGRNAGDRLGLTVDVLGDVDANGCDDVILGTSRVDTDGARAKEAKYVVLGQRDFSATRGTLRLSPADSEKQNDVFRLKKRRHHNTNEGDIKAVDLRGITTGGMASESLPTATSSTTGTPTGSSSEPIMSTTSTTGTPTGSSSEPIMSTTSTTGTPTGSSSEPTATSSTTGAPTGSSSEPTATSTTTGTPSSSAASSTSTTPGVPPPAEDCPSATHVECWWGECVPIADCSPPPSSNNVIFSDNDVSPNVSLAIDLMLVDGSGEVVGTIRIDEGTFDGPTTLSVRNVSAHSYADPDLVAFTLANALSPILRLFIDPPRTFLKPITLEIQVVVPKTVQDIEKEVGLALLDTSIDRWVKHSSLDSIQIVATGAHTDTYLVSAKIHHFTDFGALLDLEGSKKKGSSDDVGDLGIILGLVFGIGAITLIGVAVFVAFAIPYVRKKGIPFRHGKRRKSSAVWFDEEGEL